MENLIKNIEKYRNETFPESKEELEKVNKINYELNIVAKHSDDKITFDKKMLFEFIDLACKYKIIEGLSVAISLIKDSNKED